MEDSIFSDQSLSISAVYDHSLSINAPNSTVCDNHDVRQIS